MLASHPAFSIAHNSIHYGVEIQSVPSFQELYVLRLTAYLNILSGVKDNYIHFVYFLLFALISYNKNTDDKIAIKRLIPLFTGYIEIKSFIVHQKINTNFFCRYFIHTNISSTVVSGGKETVTRNDNGT